MEIIKISAIIIAVLLFTSGLLIGVLWEQQKQASLFNGNVLITSHVEELLLICKHSDQTRENQSIKRAIKLLSEGFTLNEISKLINQTK